MDVGGKQKVDLSVAIPDDASGGRYAVLLIVTNPSGGGGVTTITRLGVPLKLTIKGSQTIRKGNATIEQPWQIQPNQPISLRVTYTNDGNIHYRVRASFTVSDDRGTIVDGVLSETATVLPGYSRYLTASWIPEGGIAEGSYKVAAKVSLEDGTLLAEATGTVEVKDAYVPPPPTTTQVSSPATPAPILPSSPTPATTAQTTHSPGPRTNWIAIAGGAGGVALLAGVMFLFGMKKGRGRSTR